MSKRKNIIREGDMVKIVDPQVFVRCGYPLSFQDALEKVVELHLDKTLAFLSDIGLPAVIKPTFMSPPPDDSAGIRDMSSPVDKMPRHLQEIMRALAYAYVRKEGFGGNKRQIFTETWPDLMEKKAYVQGIKYCKTGKYFRPRSWQTWTDYGYEYEYDPGGLSHEKTHKILQLGINSRIFWMEATRTVLI